MKRRYPPTCDRDRSRLSLWSDTVPSWVRVVIVLGGGGTRLAGGTGATG